VRERGVQSRRVRAGNVEPGRRPAPPSRGGTNFWQALAIIALIAATAGWTTVAALALRGTPSTVGAVASDPTDPNANQSDPPPSHDVPDLEALLPAQVSGTALDVESATGDHVFTDGDDWATTMTTYLTGISKTPADFQYAYASDASGSIDMSIGAYRVAGVTDATGLQAALVKGWQAITTDTKISQVTLDGKALTKGDDGQGDLSYLYVRGPVVYEILTTDESIATTVLQALDVPGGTGSPAPGSSAAPSAAPSTAATPIPAPTGSSTP
jgi:hypothetical protein